MNKKGFTLMELLVTIVVLGIIVGLSLPVVRNIQLAQTEKRYTTYLDSVNYAAKLYTDSYSEDLYNGDGSGCAVVSYEDLSRYNLLKDIDMSGISCNSEYTAVKIVKFRDKYYYKPFIGCGTEKNGKAINPDIFRPVQFEASSICNADGVLMAIVGDPKSDDSLINKTIDPKVKIISETGVSKSNPPRIEYGFSYDQSPNVIDNVWTPLSFRIPSEAKQERAIRNGVAQNIPSTTPIVMPSGITGDIYLVIRVDLLKDLDDKPWKSSGDNYVYIGPYRIDNEPPDFKDSKIISSAGNNYQSRTPKLDFKVVDEHFSEESDLKMCYTYDDEDPCPLPSSYSDLAKMKQYKQYNPKKELKEISDKYDGVTHIIHVTVADAAGNYSSKDFEYTVAKSYKLKFDPLDGEKCDPNTIGQLENKAWGEAVVNETGLKNHTFCKTSKTGYTENGWYTEKDGKGTKVTKDSLATANITVYPKWKAKTVEVTFNCNGGNGGGKQTFTYGVKSQYFDKTCTKTGYTIDGWKWDKSGKESDYKVANGVIDAWIEKYEPKTTLYAHWKVNTYKLTYNSNGGSACSPASKSINYNASYGALCEPTRDGYTFLGWYTEKSGGDKVTKDTKMAAKDVTIYAHWAARNYTLTMNANGGKECNPKTKTVKYNSAYGELCTTTRNGYTFAGWYTKSSGGTKVDANTKMGIGNTTIYAHWNAKPVYITYMGNGNTGGSTAKQTCYYNQDCKLSTNGFTKTGYTWKGWFPSGSGGTKLADTIKLTGNLTVYAQWDLAKYKINYNGNGNNGGSTAYTECGYNTSCQLRSNGFTKIGHDFAGWYNAASGGTKYGAYTQLKNSITVFAHWEPKPYSVTYAGNGNTGGSTPTTTCDYNEPCTLASNGFTKTGYSWTGWWTTATGGTKYGSSVRVSNRLTVYAQWKINNYTLTFNPNGGKECNPKSKSLAYNTAYGTLCNTTRNGYTFDGWWTSATGGTKVDANTKITKDTTIYAHWSANPVTITYKGNGNTGGTMSTQTCHYNQTCTLKTNEFTKTGYSWNGWFPSATGGTKLGSTVKLTGNLIVYAQWKVNTYTLTYSGGSGCTSKLVEYGAAYGTLCNPSAKTGYTYGGWYSAASGGTKVDANTKMTTLGATVYARYNANSYTLTYDSNGGSACSSKSVVFNTAYGTLCSPTRTGYTLAGWYTAATGGSAVSATTKMTTTGAKIYAHWTLSSSVINNLKVASTTAAYNNKAVKVTFGVGVSDSEKSKLKVCVSNSPCTSSDYTKSYTASGYNYTFTGNYDGSSKRIYVGVKDAAGNVATSSADYVVYKQCSSTKAKGDWKDTSACTKKCGSGTKNQESTLVDTHLGTACAGKKTQSVACNTMSCCSSTTTVYGNWSGWSTCSKKCGGGTQKRTRTVTKKSTYDGSTCSSTTESASQSCNTMGCCTKTTTSCGSYGSWGSCSKSCGGGTKKRKRTCTKKSAYDGSKCSSYTDTDSASCNTQGCCSKTTTSCGSWGSWSTCSKKCGGGTHKRTRTCYRKSYYNGSTCSSYKDSSSGSCNTRGCCSSTRSSGCSTKCIKATANRKTCYKTYQKTCKNYSKYNGQYCSKSTTTYRKTTTGWATCRC